MPMECMVTSLCPVFGQSTVKRKPRGWGACIVPSHEQGVDHLGGH